MEFARQGLHPRVLLLHDEDGQVHLPGAAPGLRAGEGADRAHGRGPGLPSGPHRDRNGPVPLPAGARFLYIDEFGMVRWCAQTRSAWGRTSCSTASTICANSSTRGSPAAPGAASAA